MAKRVTTALLGVVELLETVMPVVERSALTTPTSSRIATSALLRAETSESATPGASSSALSVIHRTASSGSERMNA